VVKVKLKQVNQKLAYDIMCKQIESILQDGTDIKSLQDQIDNSYSQALQLYSNAPSSFIPLIFDLLDAFLDSKSHGWEYVFTDYSFEACKIDLVRIKDLIHAGAIEELESDIKLKNKISRIIR
jgi:hypothetical protein